MAVVRITESLISDVRRNISQLYDPRRREVANFPDPEDKWGDILWERGVGEYAKRVEGLPKRWFKRDTNFEFGGWLNGIGGTPDIPLSLAMSKERVVLHFTHEEVEETGLVFNGYRFHLNASDPRWDDFKEVYLAWMARRRQIDDEVLAAQHSAGALLRRFATLAPALKEWPALWDLLDLGVKDQHRKIVTRAKANKSQVQSVVPEEPMPDVTAVTTMLALNKFNKANDQ